MRFQILALAALAFAGNAYAGSIDEVVTGGPTRSIERITCAKCVTVAANKTETAPELAPGTQRVEIRAVNGELKVFRTEAWMGGSPVTFVSKAPEGSTPETARIEPAKEEPQPPKITIDKTQTSAVTADMGATAAVSAAEKSFNPDELQLRLN